MPRKSAGATKKATAPAPAAPTTAPSDSVEQLEVRHTRALGAQPARPLRSTCRRRWRSPARHSLRVTQAWCRAHSIYHPCVTHGRVSAEAGNGLLATQTIPAGQPFVSVPTREVLTETCARESDIGRAVEAANAAHDAGTSTAPAHRISPRTLLYLYLIHCRCTSANRFHAWFVHGIPRAYSSPLTWPKEELAWLQGTNLGEAVPHRLRQLRARYDNALPWLQQQQGELFPPEEFTFEAFLWAHDTYSSRGFPAQLADPKLAPKVAINPNAFSSASSNGGSQAVDGLTIEGMDAANGAAMSMEDDDESQPQRQHLGCLIPYIDLSNHRFMHPITWTYSAPNATTTTAAAAVSISPESTSSVHPHDAYLASHSLPSSSGARIVFSSGQATEKGCEILNNYGAKSNEELLMGYGFTRRDNQQDQVTVVLGRRGISEAKLALLRARHIALDHRLGGRGTASASDVLPEGLLQLMRVSVMDDSEVQQASAEWIGAVAPLVAPTAHTAAAAPGEEAAAEPVTAPAVSSKRKRKDVAPPASTTAAASSSSPPIPRLDDAASSCGVLMMISPRNERVMLQTLRALLIGRLKRLTPPPSFSPSIAGSGGLEVECPLDLALSDEDPTVVLQLAPAFFAAHTTRELALRAANESASSASAGGVPNYHLECAMSYRIGQRTVLIQAVEEVDRRIRAEGQRAQERLNQLEQQQQQQQQQQQLSAEKDEPESKQVASAPPRKTRKTGASSSVVAASSSSAPTFATAAAAAASSLDSDLLAAWAQWFAAKGGRINGDFNRDGAWRIQNTGGGAAGTESSSITGEQSASSPHRASTMPIPLLYSFPLAFASSPAASPARSKTFAPVFRLLQQQQQQEEDGDDAGDAAAGSIDWMGYALPLFLWHEMAKRSDGAPSSDLAPWLNLLVARARVWEEAEAEDEHVPTTTMKEHQIVLKALASGGKQVAACLPAAAATGASSATNGGDRHGLPSFSTMVRLAREYSIEIPPGAASPAGEEEEDEPADQLALLFVPTMPIRTGRQAGADTTTVSVLHHPSHGGHLVVHAIGPIELAVGTPVALSETFSPAGHALHTAAVSASACAVEEVSISMRAIIAAYSSLAEPEGDDEDEEEEGSNKMVDEPTSAHHSRQSLLASFGLPLQPLGRAHMRLWASIGLDAEEDAEVFLRAPSTSRGVPTHPTLLLAVARSFFLRGRFFRSPPPAAGASSAAAGATAAAVARGEKSPSGNAPGTHGAMIDDSDEEEAATTTTTAAMEIDQEEEAEEDGEDEADDDEAEAAMPTPEQLDHASRAFVRFLLQRELASRDAGGAAATAGTGESAILRATLDALE